ncbi:MAG: AarF/ABC1/UbiB kinase family protein [Deltaproteobacteria bacterium]|nr:AarF/ABC1/UbiB kinase family protein [Deltaproteobacteria bacterium]
MKLGRIVEITKVFVDEGLGFLTDRPEPARDGGAEDRSRGTALAPRVPEAELAVRLRRTLERLGPTFVKFGQLLATRVDLFSEEIIAELSKLHSHVPAFPSAEARAIIEAELERPIDEVFSELPEAPVASASVAQVYRARLRGEDGGWVAVKVQRPHLEETLLSDLEVLMDISGFIDRVVPPYRKSMVHRVASEYALRARSELDFVAEANAIEEFAEVLTTVPEFRVPKLYRALSTQRLLVMEWLEGRKLDTVPSGEALAAIGVDPRRFAHSMLRLQVSMSYEHGLVHGDTHPGNIILLPDGQIGLIDFGLHGRVPRALRDKMLEMIFNQVSGRVDEAVDAFVTVFQPGANADVGRFKEELRGVLARGAENKTLSESRFTEQLVSGMRVGARYGLKAQSDLFIVIRNLTIVEGIVLRYCPTIDPAAELRPIMAEILKRRLFGASMRAQIEGLVPQVFLTLSQRPRLAERLMHLERSFTEARNLGEFLRREGVLSEPVRRPSSPWLVLLIGALGLVAGFALRASMAL